MGYPRHLPHFPFCHVAPLQEIKKAFHRAALHWHPDKRAPAACAQQRQFQDLVFREISEAHEVPCPLLPTSRPDP